MRIPPPCPGCGFQNPAGMRFCGNCGAPLEAATESQGQAAEAPDLGEASRNEREQSGDRNPIGGIQASGERRNVSVLFADLSGYTTIAGRLDSEDLFEVVQRFIRVLIEAVHKYGGSVDKLTGDGLMALFGAPVSHENNAERAARTALDMLDGVSRLSQELAGQVGSPLAIHVGLHAGDVVVGGVGSELVMDYTAIGDTVNLARRIEEAAPPGTILASESFYRQTRPLFAYQPTTKLSLKGMDQLVNAYPLLGERTHPERQRGLEGLHAPMIGRDQELHVLQAALDRLLQDGQGQFALVTGEAGLGKSRLTDEFKLCLEQLALKVLEGQGQAYQGAIPYWIVADVLFNAMDLAHNAPLEQVRQQLGEMLARVLGSQAAQSLPYFEHVLSLPATDRQAGDRMRYLEASQLRQQISWAVCELLVAEARRKPVVLILEDLHWADEASLEVLQSVLDTVRQAPIFILAISRQAKEGTLKKAAEWAEAHLKERFHTIHLQHLTRVESEQLLGRLIAAPGLPERLREQILQRAEGIPFYLEEILRMLIDSGAVQQGEEGWQLPAEAGALSLGVPETLQGLALARFDRLDGRQRRILQVASVIGKNFSPVVLAAVLADKERAGLAGDLEALVQREFLQPRMEGSESEYTFRHILMSDAIYGTLLRKRRGALHGSVAAAIEQVFAGRLESQVELLAYHYSRSPQLLEALHYLILAGQKSARNNMNEQARQNYATALEILPKVAMDPGQAGDSAQQAHLGLGDALVFCGEYEPARLHYEEAIHALDGQGRAAHAKERSSLQRRIAKTYERQGDYEQAVTCLRKAQEELESAGAKAAEERAQIWNDLGWIDLRRGNIADAEQRLRDALELVEASSAFDVIASIENRLGGIAYNRGEWDLAASYLRKSIALREAIHDAVGLATSLNNLGLLEIEMGDFENALKNLTKSYELKARLGQTEGIAMTLNNLGWLRLQRGELEEARQALDQARELARQIGYTSLLWEVEKTTGNLHLAAGEWQKAREALLEAMAGFQEARAGEKLVDIYAMLGEAALGCEDLESAKHWERLALKAVSEIKKGTGELPALQMGVLERFRGMLAIRRGEWQAASAYLRSAEATFQRLRSRLYQGQAVFQLGALAEAQGDRGNAQVRYREAALLFRSVGARREESRAEERISDF